MAKEKDDLNDKEKGGSAIGTIFMVVLIIVVWLAIFALLIKMDVAGLGTMLRPLIKDVPVLNLILPEVSDEQLIYEEDYPYRNITEAVEEIKRLERELELLLDSDGNNEKTILELRAELDRLRAFEEDRLNFQKRVEEFDRNVVFNSQAPDVEEYKKYYEEINPDTAKEIYRQIAEQSRYDEAIAEKAELIKKMKPGNAAKALETMTADIEYTCKILLSMKKDEATAIMDKMDTLFVARLIQKMHDMDEEWIEGRGTNSIKSE